MVMIIDLPGGIDDASSSGKPADAKPTPVAGGFDFVICITLWPVFVSFTLRNAVDPTRTEPKYVLSGVITRWAGPAALALTGTAIVGLPGAAASEFTTIRSWNWPAVAAENVTVADTDAPGAIFVPIGRPVVWNGGFGNVPLAIVSVCAPRFDNVSVVDVGRPIGVPPI